MNANQRKQVEGNRTKIAYEKPFTYDPWSQMIECEDTPNIVAQMNWPMSEGEVPNENHVMLIRGWGGLHTTFGEKLGAKIQDAFGHRVAELLNEHGVGETVLNLINEQFKGEK